MTTTIEKPQHCGRPMWDVKDSANNNAPIWWCPECHYKMPREVPQESKHE